MKKSELLLKGYCIHNSTSTNFVQHQQILVTSDQIMSIRLYS